MASTIYCESSLQAKINAAGEAFDRFAREEAEQQKHEPDADKPEHPEAPGLLREWRESGIGSAYGVHYGEVY